MKNLIAIFLLSMTLTSCLKQEQSVTVEGAFQVQFLFEKDGCSVYRFFDGGRSHYFTTCGETISTQHKYQENIKTY